MHIESERRGRRESVRELLQDLTDNKLSIKCTRANKSSRSFNHIFQALFLRIENSKLNLSAIVNSSLCQMILSAYLYPKYKHLKMFTLSSNGSHVSNTMGGKSKAFFRTEAWRYTISVENLAYKLKCIVYQAQIITENMHFYPLHTTSKVSFLGFGVWFCSAVAARGPGSLMAPYPESQGARHTLACHLQSLLPLISHCRREAVKDPSTTSPSRRTKAGKTALLWVLGISTQQLSPVNTKKSAEDQGRLLDNSSTGGESCELTPKYKPVSTASLELLATSPSSTTNQKSSVEDTR